MNLIFEDDVSTKGLEGSETKGVEWLLSLAVGIFIR